MVAHNPLLAPMTALLDYAAITPAHVEPAITQLLQDARQAVTHAVAFKGQATWETIVEPMQVAASRLWRAWSVVGHLNAVVNTPPWRAAYHACLPRITEFSTWVEMHGGLYAQYQRLRATPLSAARQRVVELVLRDMRLGGVELEGDARKRYAELSDQQAQAAQKFSENVLDAMDRWYLTVTDPARLAGLPQDVQDAARAAAKDANESGYRLTLHMPCYQPVLQYAEDRTLRETLYRAYSTIASDQGADPALDNSPWIEQLLAHRAEQAALTGHGHYADLRLQTRMARSVDQVQTLLRDLAARAKPHGQEDLAQLRAFAADALGLDDLQPWDLAYAAEKLRQQRYAYSEDEVRQYFSETQVLQGLFHVVQTLFGVTLHVEEHPVWHAHAQVLRAVGEDGSALGYLYMDLYARAGKQSGAWVDSERVRQRIHGKLATPVVMLTCNFPAPAPGRPVLLTHDEVITLFHESGHALHALLSTQDEPALAPFASVEWDAIELPSQFMENFCWDWDVVQRLSRHVQSGEPLPRTLFDKMLAARHYQSGMRILRQIEFALFDLLIHSQRQALPMAQVMRTLDQVRQDVAVITPPAWHRFPHNFSHLFAGGYGAGYYSYLWAEILSADAFAAFEQAEQNVQSEAQRDSARQAARNTTRQNNPPGVLNPHLGRRFRDEILAVGGARSTEASFRAFRGRDVSLDALLRHNGIA